MRKKSEDREDLFPYGETVEFYEGMLKAFGTKKRIRQETLDNSRSALNAMYGNSKKQWMTYKDLTTVRMYSKVDGIFKDVNILEECNVKDLLLKFSVSLGYFEKKKIGNKVHYRSTRDEVIDEDILKIATLKNIAHNSASYVAELKRYITAYKNAGLKTPVTASKVDNRHEIVLETYNEINKDANVNLEKLNNIMGSPKIDSFIDAVAYEQQNQERIDEMNRNIKFIRENPAVLEFMNMISIGAKSVTTK